MKFATALLALALVVPAAHAQEKRANAAADASACCDNPAKAGRYQATGIVKKTDAARSSATISHDAIAALNWPAMTMAFRVRDKNVLDKLAASGKVRFTFVQDGRDYVITAVQ